MVTVDCLVIEAGSWELPDGRLIEAHRVISTTTNGSGSWSSQVQSYSQNYTNPVVLGQVMTTNDAEWSVFWSNNGSSQSTPPSASDIGVGKHIGSGGIRTRVDETLGYVVIEAGNGDINGIAYEAAVGPDIVRGVLENSGNGYSYDFNTPFTNTPSFGLVGQVAMDGGDGSWAQLLGGNSLTSTELILALDEDQIEDSERNHTEEQVAYLVFAEPIIVGGNSSISPEFSGIVDLTHAEGEVVSQTLAASDFDGDPLSFSATGLPPGLSIDAVSGEVSGIATQAGTYDVTATVSDGQGGSDTVSFVWQINPSSSRIIIPGRLQIEDYNTGGQNIGYFDTTPGNQGSHVGFSDDIDISGSFGFRTHTSFVIRDEWARYNVNIETAGTYTLNVRYGTSIDNFRFRIELDGQVIDRFVLPSTGSFGTFETLSFPGIQIPEGDFTLRVYFEDSGVSLDFIDFVLTDVAEGSNSVPKFSNIVDLTHAEGEVISQTLVANDFDGDQLSFGATGLPPGLSIDATTGEITGTVSQAGTYAVAATVSDGQGGSDEVNFSWFVNQPSSRIIIPGRLEAEDYNPGGQNIGYFDTTPGNQGSHVGFTDDIDISGSFGFRTATSFVIRDEWARYNVDIETAGTYTLNVRYGREAGTFRLRVELDGQVIDRLLLPNTGSFGTYETLSFPGIELPEGDFTMRLYFEGAGLSLDRIDFVLTDVALGSNAVPKFSNVVDFTHAEGEVISQTLVASDFDGDSLSFSATGLPPGLIINAATGEITGTATTAGIYEVTATAGDGQGASDTVNFSWYINTAADRQRIGIPGRLQAEDYNPGGQNVGYFDTTPGNQGSHVGFTDDIDISGSVGFRVATSFVIRDEWARYNVNIAEAGIYTLNVRYGRQAGTFRLRIELDGETIDRLLLPNTGSFGTYETLSFPGIELPEGDFTMRLYFEGAGLSLDFIDFELTQSTSTTAPQESLIAVGSEWNYLDDGSNQGTAWRESVFDDSTWLTGPAQLGFGDGDEATVISFGNDPNNKPITTYFRRSFNVGDSSVVENLRVNLLRDDGAVVYLNGAEVIRTNLPNGSITYTTRALVGASGIDESGFVAYTIPSNMLVNGTNVIAVEVHQHRPNSSDLSFDLGLSFTDANAEDRIILEAEDAILFGLFDVGADINASGGGFAHVPDANRPTVTTPNAADRIDFSINIEQAGQYRVDATAFGSSGSNNSFHVGVDGDLANTIAWGFPSTSSYELDAVSSSAQDPVLFNLSAGVHTLNFYLREDGARLDRIELTLVEPTPVPPSGLALEAEDAILFGLFETGEDTNANGGAFAHVPDANRSTVTTPNAADRIDFNINIEQAGQYRIDGTAFGSSGSNNSFHVGVDGDLANTIAWGFPSTSSYELDAVSSSEQDPVLFNLTTGVHTLNFYLREDGARLDRIELTLVEPTPVPPTGLAIEAEDAILFGLFEVGADVNASGGEFAHVPDATRPTVSTPNAADRIDFNVDIEQAGQYRIDATAFGSSGSNNSFHVGVDGDLTNTIAWGFPSTSGYELDPVSSSEQDPVLFNLSAGVHTLNFYLREDGARLDRIQLILVNAQGDNTPPVAEDASFNSAINNPISATLVATDAENDALTYSIETAPSSGTLDLADSSTGAFIYTPNADFTGSDSFTFIVNDGQADSNLATVSLNIVGDPVITIVAPPDGFLTNQETIAITGMVVNTETLTLDGVDIVLDAEGGFTVANVTLVEGENTLTFTATNAVGNVAQQTLVINRTTNNQPVAFDVTFSLTVGNQIEFGQLNASDEDGDTLSFNLVSSVSDGVITLNLDGSFSYLPNDGFIGNDSFTFSVNDGAFDSNIATVSIAVVANPNIAPIAINDAIVVNVDAVFNGALSATDENGDELSFSIVTEPTKGTIELDSNTGLYTYTPIVGQLGTDSFTFVANDGQANSALGTILISINQSNDNMLTGLILIPDPSLVSTSSGIEQVLDFLITSAIADLVGVVTAPSGLLVELVSLNAEGVVDGIVATTTTDSSGQYSFNLSQLGMTPGTDLAVQVTLLSGESLTAIVTSLDVDITLESETVYQELLVQADAGVPIENFTLAEIDALVDGLRTVSTNSGTNVETDISASLGMLATLLDGADVLTDFVDDAAAPGQLEPSRIQALTNTPVNSAPEAVEATFNTFVDIAITAGQLVGNDLDNDPVTFSLVSNVSNGVLALNPDGSFDYTPNSGFEGTDSFIFLVSDGELDSNAATVTIDVVLPPPPLVAAELSLEIIDGAGFQFSWIDVAGATFYRVFEDPDGVSGFTQVSGDISSGVGSFTLDVDLSQRINARYFLQSCNAGGCTDSATVSVSNTIVEGIAYFKASNTGSGDRFSEVSLSGNGLTLAIGAPLEDSNAIGINGDESNNAAADSGAVYVFTLDIAIGLWNQQAYIKAGNAGSGDQFGQRLSLSDDGNTLAVAARNEDGSATGINGATDNNAANAGAVYVFTRNGDEWSQQAYIKASNTGAGDLFGRDLDISGDGRTLVVGAIDEDSNATGVGGEDTNNGAPGSGAVYVFTFDDIAGSWSQQAYIKASNTGIDDEFGVEVALSDEGNTLAVGARHEDSQFGGINANQQDNSIRDTGAVYVFTRSGNQWQQQAYIKASNPGFFDQFGDMLAISGDGNTLTVGAPTEDGAATGINGNQEDGATFSGAVYVFSRTLNVWSQQAYIKASNTQAEDSFGGDICLSRDGNVLFVGAVFEDSNAVGIGGDQQNNSTSNAGAGYIFTRSGTEWNQRSYVKASNTESSATGISDVFGVSCSVSGDGQTIAVGANREDSDAKGVGGDQTNNNITDSGAVYLFDNGVASGGIPPVLNVAPVAEDASFNTVVDIAINGGQLVGGDFNNDTLIFNLIDDVGNGVLTLNADGSFDYTPNLGFSGADSFTFLVNDGELDSNTATVTIDVILPAAPLVAAELSLEIIDGVGFQFSWADVGDATFYRVFEDPDGISGFTQISGDIASGVESFTLDIDLSQRINARYFLQSCNAGGCIDSTVISASNTIVEGVNYIKASNTNAEDRFTIVSISADGRTLAVGAPLEDSNAIGINGDQTNNSASNSGAVYIFTLDSATSLWSQQAYIKASNTGSSDEFGSAVSLSDDGNTLAVGARFEDSQSSGVNNNQGNVSNSFNSGAAYIYTRENGIWTQQAYIKASNTDERDEFGGAVAISGDGNTLVVGARLEDSLSSGVNGSESEQNPPPNGIQGNSNVSGLQADIGAAYVFVRSDTNWSQQAYIKSAPQFLSATRRARFNFGNAVDLDFSGNTLVVGEIGQGLVPSGFLNNSTGAAHVYVRNGAGVWSRQAFLTASNREANDQFGIELSISGDGNTVAIGANGEDSSSTGVNRSQGNGSSGSGALYVFTRSGTSWSQQSYLKASNTGAGDAFGRFVCISSDSRTLVVASSGEDSSVIGISGDQTDNGASDSGAVYSFTLDGAGQWVQQSYIKASNTDAGDSFDICGLSGDGARLVVGANLEDSNAVGINGDQLDNSASNSGAAYIYEGNAINLGGGSPNNVAPVAGSQTGLVTPFETVLTGTLSVTDVDSNNFLFSVVSRIGGAVEIDNATGVFTFTPEAGFEGQASFSYVVSDFISISNVATVGITVQPGNIAPIAVDDIAGTEEGVAVDIEVLANDTDENGDALSVVSLDTTGLLGTASVNNNIVTYDPNNAFAFLAADQVGQEQFVYTIDDGNGGLDSGLVTVNITGQNDAPIAVNDDGSVTDEDTPITINVLANDSDVDSASISVSEISNIVNGSATIDNNSVIFTPALDFFGQASFSYTLTDGIDTSNLAVVSIEVLPVNDIPVAANDSYVVAEDTVLSGSSVLLDNGNGADSDVDGDSLVVNTTPVVNVTNGSLVLNGDGTFTYTPGANFLGVDGFTYEVSDGNGGVAQGAVTITVNGVNDLPVANNDSVITPEDISINVEVLTNDFDVDGDALSIVSVTNVTNGIAVINANLVVFTPAANFVGQASFDYTVSDSIGVSNVATVLIDVTPVNDAPVVSNASFTTAFETSLNGVLTGTDVENGSLVFAVTSGVGGTVTVNQNTGAFTFVPASGFSGTAIFTFFANDGTVDSNVATVSVIVEGLQLLDGEKWINGLPTSGALEALDLNGDGLTDIVHDGLPGTPSVNPAFLDPSEFTSSYNSNGSSFLVGGNIINRLNPLVLFDRFPGVFNSGTGSFGVWVLSNRQFSDFNGDGLLDVIVSGNVVLFAPAPPTFQLRAVASTTARSVSYNTGSGYTSGNLFSIQPNEISTGNEYSFSPKVGDFNGDGRSDVLEFRGTIVSIPFGFLGDNFSVELSNGQGFGSIQNWLVSPNVEENNFDNVAVIDLNNDGRDDLVQITESSVFAWLSTGTSFTQRINWAQNIGTTEFLTFADVNGDNLDDLVRPNSDGTVTVWLSTGVSTNSPQIWGGGFGGDRGWVVIIDINGDSRSDVARFNNGNFSVFLSTGLDFNDTGISLGSGLGSNINDLLFEDFSGDGRIDIFRRSGAMGFVHVSN